MPRSTEHQTSKYIRVRLDLIVKTPEPPTTQISLDWSQRDSKSTVPCSLLTSATNLWFGASFEVPPLSASHHCSNQVSRCCMYTFKPALKRPSLLNLWRWRSRQCSNSGFMGLLFSGVQATFLYSCKVMLACENKIQIYSSSWILNSIVMYSLFWDNIVLINHLSISCIHELNQVHVMYVYMLHEGNHVYIPFQHKHDKYV